MDIRIHETSTKPVKMFAFIGMWRRTIVCKCNLSKANAVFSTPWALVQTIHFEIWEMSGFSMECPGFWNQMSYFLKIWSGDPNCNMTGAWPSLQWESGVSTNSSSILETISFLIHWPVKNKIDFIAPQFFSLKIFFVSILDLLERCLFLGYQQDTMFLPKPTIPNSNSFHHSRYVTNVF